MSWLTDLAGKAENLLNKLDQNAASALAKEESTGNTPLPMYDTSHWTRATSIIPRPYSTPVSNISQSSNSGPRRKSLSPPSKDTDDELIKFLNSPEPTPKKTPVAKPIPTVRSVPNINPFGNILQAVTIQPTVQKMISNTDQQSDLLIDVPESSVQPVPLNETSISHENNTCVVTIDSTPAEPDSQRNNSPITIVPVVPEVKAIDFNNEQQPIAMVTSRLVSNSDMSVEMENRLLQNEVQTLRQEVSQLLQRVRTVEAEKSKFRKHLADQSNQMISQEQDLNQIRKQHSDLEKLVAAREAQVLTLQTECVGAKHNVVTLQEKLRNVNLEKERLLQDANDSSGQQSETIVDLQEKISSIEKQLELEQDNHAAEIQRHIERVSRFEVRNSSLEEEASHVQLELTQERNNIEELKMQLARSQELETGVQEELKEYKLKAQRTLQSKEKLITSLREAQTNGMEMENMVSVAELEHVKHERDLLQEEVFQLSSQLQSVQNSMASLESKMQGNQERSLQLQMQLQTALQQEVQRRKGVEEDCNQQAEEVRYLSDELSRQKEGLGSKVQEREQEISKLRKQLTAKQLATTSEAELEVRIHSLTENLIQKQTHIENISMEKNSLLLQLERLEMKYRESMSSIPSQHVVTTVTAANDTDDAKSSLPSFLIESPFDTGVTRRMKKAYSCIDSFSIRFGVFLRRYPIARIFLIFYMVLLHLWVMIVLFTYTPEIHGADFH